MISDGKDKEKSGGADEGDKVEGGESARSDGTENCNGNSEDDADVEDVASENVAKDKLGFALFCGDDCSDEFGKGSSEGDYS